MSVKTIYLSKQSTVNGKKAYATGDVALNLKEYITAIIDENTPSVNNGLSITSGNIGLDGILVRDTNIDIDGNELHIGDTDSNGSTGLVLNNTNPNSSFKNFFGTEAINVNYKTSTGIIQTYTSFGNRFTDFSVSSASITGTTNNFSTGGYAKFFVDSTTNAIAFSLNSSTAVVTIKKVGGVETVSAVLPTYANNAAAVSGGLTANMLYKTSTGELRIVV